jgi:hypothetical protein
MTVAENRYILVKYNKKATDPGTVYTKTSVVDPEGFFRIRFQILLFSWFPILH